MVPTSRAPEASQAESRLAVYGTLRPGQPNHHQLDGLDGEWRKVTAMNLALDDRRVWIEIPTGFTEMQQQAPDPSSWRKLVPH